MNIEKIRNLGPDELRSQDRDASDQIFRLKFQLKMGQTTGLKKMRELRKDLARIKTIARERELGISTQTVANAAGSAPAAEAKPAPEKTVAKKSAAKKTASKAAAPKKKSALKKQAAKKKTAKKAKR